MSAASSLKAMESEGAQPQSKEEERWAPFLILPCRLTVDLALPGFKVADFVSLRPGSILGTGWGLSRDLPLRVNETLIGWCELEGNGGRLAVRVTELI